MEAAKEFRRGKWHDLTLIWTEYLWLLWNTLMKIGAGAERPVRILTCQIIKKIRQMGANHVSGELIKCFICYTKTIWMWFQCKLEKTFKEAGKVHNALISQILWRNSTIVNWVMWTTYKLKLRHGTKAMIEIPKGICYTL